MTEINFQRVKEKINNVRNILNKLDHVVTLFLNPSIYMNGDCFIKLSGAEKTKLKNEYLQIKAELETKVGDLPE